MNDTKTKTKLNVGAADTIRHQRVASAGAASGANLKTIDERALEYKARLQQYLEAIAALMNEAAKDGIAVSFKVDRNEHGSFVPVNVALTRTY